MKSFHNKNSNVIGNSINIPKVTETDKSLLPKKGRNGVNQTLNYQMNFIQNSTM